MGAFKLGKMTFGSLFKQPETIQYPIEKKPQPKGLKGHIVIDVDRCIVCGMCDRNCSTDCIKVDRKERTWEIDPFACVQCGYCVTVCPKDCLAMDPNYWPASTERSAHKFTIPEQEKKPTAKKQEAEQKPDPAKKSEPEKPAAEAPKPQANDAQLETLIGQMDAEKAAKVKAALKR